MSKNLVKKFQNISRRYDLWKKGDKIVIACSGGPDSSCLLDIFFKLQKKYDIKIIIAHVNYGLRGQDSDKDEKFVSKLAEKYGLKMVKTSIPKSKFGKISENRLREIRYDFFEKVRRENEYNLIAVGHTLDDQAETYLMRVIRGSGLNGLSVMKHKNDKIIRPLLGITREEVMDYLRNNGLRYRLDKTNRKMFFLRNKIRNELIPLLEKKYNPNIKKTLYHSSLIIAEDYSLINDFADIYKIKVKEEVLIKNISKLHPALQKLIILEMIKKVRQSLKDIKSAHVEEVLKIIKSTKNKRQVVKFQGLKFIRISDKLKIINLKNDS